MNTTDNTKQINKPVPKFTTILIISFFLGHLGVDRYLLGYKNWWVKAITMGGCAVWSLIDLINIATGKMKMEDGRDLE